MRIATAGVRTGFAMTGVFARGGVERADRGVRPLYKNADDLARAGGVEPRPYAAYGDRIS